MQTFLSCQILGTKQATALSWMAVVFDDDSSSYVQLFVTVCVHYYTVAGYGVHRYHIVKS